MDDNRLGVVRIRVERGGFNVFIGKKYFFSCVDICFLFIYSLRLFFRVDRLVDLLIS